MSKKRRNTKRRNTKRRNTKRRYSRQRGGLFNEEESNILKVKLREIGFTDEDEIKNIIKDMGTFSQRFSGEYLSDLFPEMDDLNKDTFYDWLEKVKEEEDEEVETDGEWRDRNRLDDDNESDEEEED